MRPVRRHAGAVFGLPFSGFAYSLSFEVAGRPPVAPGERPSIQIRVATPDYFAAVGIPVRRGRGFGADDRADQHERPERVGLAVDDPQQREEQPADPAEQEAGVDARHQLPPAEVAEQEGKQRR